MHFFDHWRLTMIDQTQLHYIQRTSSILSGRHPREHIVLASQSHRCVRRLGYSCIVYAKHYSYGSEKQLGWRTSGKQSGITNMALSQPTFHSANRRTCNSIRKSSEGLPFEVVRRPTMPCYTRSSKCACIAPTHSYSMAAAAWRLLGILYNAHVCYPIPLADQTTCMRSGMGQ